MSTNAQIGIMQDNGKILAVYLHWDGYPDHAGKILNEFYNTPEKIYELLQMGEISSIAPSIDECEFYMRDRGQKDCVHQVYSSEEWWKQSCGGYYYYYLFKDGKWHVTNLSR